MLPVPQQEDSWRLGAQTHRQVSEKAAGCCTLNRAQQLPACTAAPSTRAPRYAASEGVKEERPHAALPCCWDQPRPLGTPDVNNTSACPQFRSRLTPLRDRAIHLFMNFLEELHSVTRLCPWQRWHWDSCTLLLKRYTMLSKQSRYFVRKQRGESLHQTYNGTSISLVNIDNLCKLRIIRGTEETKTHSPTNPVTVVVMHRLPQGMKNIKRYYWKASYLG